MARIGYLSAEAGTTGDRQWVAYDLDLATGGDQDLTSDQSYDANGVTLTATNHANASAFDIASGAITCTPNAGTAYGSASKTGPTVAFDLADLTGTEPAGSEEFVIQFKLTHPSVNGNTIDTVREGTASADYLQRALVTQNPTGSVKEVTPNTVDGAGGAGGTADARTIGLVSMRCAGGTCVISTAAAGSDYQHPETGSVSALTDSKACFSLAFGGTDRFAANRVRVVFRCATAQTPQAMTVSGIRVYMLEAI